MDKFNDKKTLVSEFNEAAYQILRLHQLWQTCNILSRKGHLEEWKWVLDRIWVELSPDATRKDEEKYFGSIKEKNKSISKAKNKQELYTALTDKEIFLRCLQESVGKGSKTSQKYEKIM
jgi:hypothetical protein